MQPMDVKNDVAIVGNGAFSPHWLAAELNQFPCDMASRHGDDLNRQRERAQCGDSLALVSDTDKPVSDRRNDLLPR